MDKGDPALQHKHISGCLRSHTTWFSIVSIKVCGKGLEEEGPAMRIKKQQSLWLPFLSHTGVWCGAAHFHPPLCHRGGSRTKTRFENSTGPVSTSHLRGISSEV